MGRDLTSKDKPPHYMCYHVKFGSSESKCVCKNTREPQTLGSDGHRSLRFRRDWSPRNSPLPTCVILPNFVVL